MGSDSAKFEVIFQTTANLDGAEKTTAAIDKVTAAAGATEKATEGVAAAQKEGAKASHEAATAHGHTTAEMQALRLAATSAKEIGWAFANVMKGDYVTAMHEAKFATIGLTTAIKANPMAIGVAALSLAITGLSGLLGHGSKAMEEMGTKGEESAKSVDKTAAAAERAKKPLEEMNERLKNGADQAARQRKALDELSDTETASKLAGVDLAEAQNKITPQEAQSQRTDIREAARVAALQRKLKESEDLATAAQTERARAEEAQRAAFLDMTEKNAAVEAALEAARAAGVKEDVPGALRVPEARQAMEEARNPKYPALPGSEFAAEMEQRNAARIEALDQLNAAVTRRDTAVSKFAGAVDFSKGTAQKTEPVLEDYDTARKTIPTAIATAKTAADAERAKTARSAEQAAAEAAAATDKALRDGVKKQIENIITALEQKFAASAAGSKEQDQLISQIAAEKKKLIDASVRSASPEDAEGATLAKKGVDLEADGQRQRIAREAERRAEQAKRDAEQKAKEEAAEEAKREAARLKKRGLRLDENGNRVRISDGRRVIGGRRAGGDGEVGGIGRGAAGGLISGGLEKAGASGKQAGDAAQQAAAAIESGNSKVISAMTTIVTSSKTFESRIGALEKQGKVRGSQAKAGRE